MANFTLPDLSAFVFVFATFGGLPCPRQLAGVFVVSVGGHSVVLVR